MKWIEGLNKDEVSKRKAIEWCNEHGIDPSDVPVYGAVESLDGEYGDHHVGIEVWDRTSAGHPQWDSKNNRVLTRMLWVEAKRPVPEELLEE